MLVKIEDQYDTNTVIETIIHNDTQSYENCGYFEGYTYKRFIFLFVFAVVSLSGVIANFLLMAVFRRTFVKSIYLFSLATCDCLLCLTYLLLFGVDAAIVYFKSKLLFFLYHRYIIPVYYLSKVVQFAMPFILIMITFERYLWTCTESKRKRFSDLFDVRGRLMTIITILIVSIVLRCPIFLVTYIAYFPQCNDYFRRESVVTEEWAAEGIYHFYDFHFITVIQMLIPFILLFFLNLTIVKRLIAEKKENMCPTFRGPGGEGKKVSCIQGNLPENYVLLQVATDVIKGSLVHNEPIPTDTDNISVGVSSVDDLPRHRPSIFHTFVLALRQSSRTKRSQLRNAIYTMLTIVFSYLVCNGVHLFLTILERFSPSLLYSAEDRNISSTFYIIISDFVSIAYMVSSAIRIIIYCKCNMTLRSEIWEYLKGNKQEPQDNS